MPNKIVVVIQGGLVQDISGIPEGVEVEVRDYDIEGSDPDTDPTEKDEDGREYFSATYVRWHEDQEGGDFVG